MDPVTIAAAAAQLIPLAAQLVQQAVAAGSMTEDDANALWTKSMGDWKTAAAAWTAGLAQVGS